VPFLEAAYGKRYPAIGQMCRRAWEHVVPFFVLRTGIRKMIYTRMRSKFSIARCTRSSTPRFPNDDGEGCVDGRDGPVS
jgi:putative transposase